MAALGYDPENGYVENFMFGGRIELSQRSPAVFSILLNAVPKSLDPNNVLPQGALVSVGRRRRF